MTKQTVVTTILVATAWMALSATGGQDQRRRREPQVKLVQTVGCVERHGDREPTWWLSGAAEPTEARAGVFNRTEIDEIAGAVKSGARVFQLVGVADFLDVDGLLVSGDRQLFTTAEQANATGELRTGRTVLVKGLLIETDGDSRINLIAVVGLSETCE